MSSDARRPKSGESPAPAPGELYILSAPSGAGKTTLLRRLLAGHPALAATLAFSVSHTTRPPRVGEVAGRDYHFVEPQQFRDMIAAGRFLEWAEVHGRYYGTSSDAVASARALGVDVVLEIDVQGAEQIRARYPQTPSIFIMPPSFAELEERLRRRGHDGAEQIARRLGNALAEVRQYKSYDYVILNDDLDRACEALAAVFLARRCHRGRMERRIESVLERFPSGSQAH